MTDRPLLSIVIASIGRPTLPRTLASIRGQMSEQDAEVIVVADAHNTDLGVLAWISEQALAFGARYCAVDAHGHFGGHPQIQHGHELAIGEYILNLGDDDEYLPDGLIAVREAVGALDRPRPLLFRAVMKNGSTLWAERELRRSRISGQCIAAPNDPARLGFWWDDYAFIEGTVMLHGGPESIVWCEETIALCH